MTYSHTEIFVVIIICNDYTRLLRSQGFIFDIAYTSFLKVNLKKLNSISNDISIDSEQLKLSG